MLALEASSFEPDVESSQAPTLVEPATSTTIPMGAAALFIAAMLEPILATSKRRECGQVQIAIVLTPARLPEAVRPTMKIVTATPSTLPGSPWAPK